MNGVGGDFYEVFTLWRAKEPPGYLHRPLTAQPNDTDTAFSGRCGYCRYGVIKDYHIRLSTAGFFLDSKGILLFGQQPVEKGMGPGINIPGIHTAALSGFMEKWGE